MSTLDVPTSLHRQNLEPTGVRLHRFTVGEYHRMREFGVLKKDDPVELLDGHIYVKPDHGPPYRVPLGIPPEVIAGQNVEPFAQRRFTVDEYQKLMDSRALPPTLRTELVEGWIVDKMARNPRHDSTLRKASKALSRHIGKKWELGVQTAVTMDDGVLEPDISILPGPPDRFTDEHPIPFEVELVVEVSDTTLAYDRGMKLRDYARNGIRRYWILNVIARQIEEYTEPTGPTDEPKFGIRRIYKQGESVPLILGDRKQKPVLVDELLWSK